MEVDTVTGVAPNVTEYIRDNVAGARRLLAEAHGLFAERPAMNPPTQHMERAIAPARNAAEHLYDVGQVDDPVEAVREALAAAEAIMTVVQRFDVDRPGMVDRRELAAAQLREVDGTLAGLERALHIPAERTHAAALAAQAAIA